MGTISNAFLDLVNNPVFNMNTTIRYSLLYQVQPENLSNHVTEVMWLSYMIAIHLNRECGEHLDVGRILESALIHDADEVLTGDIPRSTKYYSQEGLDAMRQVAHDSMAHLASELGDPDILSKWDQAKDGYDGTVVKLADMLCVSHKVITEVKLLGNAYFLKVAKEMKDNLCGLIQSVDFSMFTPEASDWIRRLCYDALAEMNLILDDERFMKYGISNYVFSGEHQGR